MVEVYTWRSSMNQNGPQFNWPFPFILILIQALIFSAYQWNPTGSRNILWNGKDPYLRNVKHQPFRPQSLNPTGKLSCKKRLFRRVPLSVSLFHYNCLPSLAQKLIFFCSADYSALSFLMEVKRNLSRGNHKNNSLTYRYLWSSMFGRDRLPSVVIRVDRPE